MIRITRLSGRQGKMVGLVVGLIVVLGGILAWAGRDPSPPRRLIAAPDASRPQGFTADGRSFVTLSPEGVVFWDLTTGQPRRPWTLRAIPISAFSADGRSCVGEHGYDYESAKIVWVDVASGEVKANFFAKLPRVVHLSFTDGDRAIRAFLADRTGTLREVVTWDLATGAETRRPLTGPKKGGGGEAWPAGVSRDGRVLAFLDLARDGVQLWDAETDQPLGGLLRTPSTQLVQSYDSAAFTPGDDRLIISRADGAVEVWNLADRRWLRTIPIHPAGHVAIGLQIAPDGRTLASSRFHHAGPSWASRFWSGLAKPLGVSLTNQGRSDEVVVVDLQTGARLARWPGSFQPKFSPDGRTVVTHESWLGTFAIRDTPRPPAR